MSNTRFVALITPITFALILRFLPPPLHLSQNVWHLFAIFITVITAILFNLLPIITAALIALAIFNATITPQDSSCNAIYLSSDYINTREIYIYGGAVTLLAFVIFMFIGTPWILALT